MKILYEDEDIIVLHKMAGFPAQSHRAGEMDVISEVKVYLSGAQRGRTSEPYAALINRLDQPVEGVMLLAKNEYAARELSGQLQSGKIKKEYTAGVFSAQRPDIAGRVRLDDFIEKGRDNLSRIVTKKSDRAKRAILDYELIDGSVKEKYGGYTCELNIELFTGRHHQIRLQLANAGYPIIGDRKYGFMPDGYSGPLRLICRCLSFYHRGQYMRFEIQ